VDLVSKKNAMALFYFLIGASVLLGLAKQAACGHGRLRLFLDFDGRDYMLVSLVTAECFGTSSLGKLLALIHHGVFAGPVGISVGCGRIFGCAAVTIWLGRVLQSAGIIGGTAIYAIRPRKETKSVIGLHRREVSPLRGLPRRRRAQPQTATCVLSFDRCGCFSRAPSCEARRIARLRSARRPTPTRSVIVERVARLFLRAVSAAALSRAAPREHGVERPLFDASPITDLSFLFRAESRKLPVRKCHPATATPFQAKS